MLLNKIVVADAGPLIAFAKLELLSLFPEVQGKVLVPEAVLNECVCESKTGGFA